MIVDSRDFGAFQNRFLNHVRYIKKTLKIICNKIYQMIKCFFKLKQLGEFMVKIIEFYTNNFVESVKPLEHSIHYLSCTIEKKGGKMGSHLIYFLLYPARIVDRVIQLTITPLICVFGNIYEAVAIPFHNPNERYWKHICSLPLTLPFYLTGNLIQRSVKLAAAVLPIAAIYGVVYGSKVGNFYFANEHKRVTQLADENHWGSTVHRPHLPNIPVSMNFIMSDQDIIDLEKSENHGDLGICLFF